MKKAVWWLLGLLVAGGLARAQTPTPNCDFNGDGLIDHEDLFIFMKYWQTESSIPLSTPTPTVPTYTISGHVAEFPGCGGSMRGVQVALLPLGATTQTSLNDGSFSFLGIPNGEYTLSISPPCNPFGCYPDTPVTVAGENVFVEICPLSGATPTITPTRTFTPTNTPTGQVHTVSGYVAEFPGCGGRMRGVQVALLPLGATTQTSLNDGSFSFLGIPNGEYTLSISPPCNPFGCYPDTPVTVAGENVFVEICPLPGATPTFTATSTPGPTQPPTPSEITIDLAGLPADASPLVMVRIAAGSFEMGWPPFNYDELPVHTVDIGYEFYIAKYEITQAQWLAMMENWPGDPPSELYGLGENYPAYNLSWDDCQQFVAELNALDQGSFRLPTEAEWEYACRAGTETAYYFGHYFEGAGECADPEAGVMPGNYSDYMWFCGNNGAYDTAEYGSKRVGLLLPNAWGLHDMSGNILEWCQDWYHIDYEGAPSDGSAWQSPETNNRVLRGGGWEYDDYSCRSADRLTASPGSRNPYFGFRVVRNL